MIQVFVHKLNIYADHLRLYKKTAPGFGLKARGSEEEKGRKKYYDFKASFS